MSADEVSERARKHMAEMNMPVGSDHPALIALGAPDLRPSGSVRDLRTAIAREIVDHCGKAWGPYAPDLADKILAVVAADPGLRQAWERSQAIDSAEIRQVAASVDTVVLGDDATMYASGLLLRLRGVGVSKEPT